MWCSMFLGSSALSCFPKIAHRSAMPFEQYFRSLQSIPVAEVTEHSHRSTLETLLKAFATKGQRILHEPKRGGRFGSPDFKISHTETIVGYVENKKIGENLDKTLKSEQVKKYQSLSGNLLITNYLEWIWLRDGKVQQREMLAYETDLANPKAIVSAERTVALEKLLRGFFSQAPREIADVKKLAEALALRARLLKDFLLEELERQEKEKQDGRLFQLYATFREHVFSELAIAEFADAFAQNLVYGLFLARLNADHQVITLNDAQDYIPHSFHLIRELVDFLRELKHPEYQPIRWVVEEVLSIVNNLDLSAIVDSLSFVKKRRPSAAADDFGADDPFLYFYEPFLKAYDPKLREQRGVYYTPPPVVDFIVRATDHLLQTTFGIREGLANRQRVTVLDFAVGTGTFLLRIIRQILESLPPQSGKRDLLVREHILKNLFGFEYLIAPYTIAHLKLSQYLRDVGYTMQPDERLQVFLTNTLEPIDKQVKIPFLPALSEESRQAQRVKDKPVLVITGNPPYSGISKNNGQWISGLIDTYKYVDGKHFGEQKHWLNDDYVKFIRFAQEKMDQVEEGIVAIITNHRFLTNSTFRGMRQSLMKSFNQIWLLDLHGSNLPKETPSGGGIDENVFDIKQGVSISFFVKKTGLERKIFHAEFWGSSIDKYHQCLESDMESITWEEILPTTPFYLFKVQKSTLQEREEYQSNWPLQEIFFLGSSGVVMGRDKQQVTIKFDKEILWELIKDFSQKSPQQIREDYKLGNDSRDWQVKSAQQDVQINLNRVNLRSIHYRPFDKRFTFYTGNSRGFYSSPQKKVMSHFLGHSNLGLAVGRAGQNVENVDSWNLVFISDEIIDYNLFSRGGEQFFPLYTYEKKDIKKPNFTPAFISFVQEKYPLENPSPEEIFGYLYAALHSPTYRHKYAEFLKIDFPRIPFPTDIAIFRSLSALGSELVAAHLLERVPPGYKQGEYLGQGSSHVVEKATFIADAESFGTGRLHINATSILTAYQKRFGSFTSAATKCWPST